MLNHHIFHFVTLQHALPEGKLHSFHVYVDLDPSDPADNCFWIQMFRCLNPPFNTYFMNIWGERHCIGPTQTDRHVTYNVTDDIDVQPDDFFGWTCEDGHKCPMYLDKFVTVHYIRLGKHGTVMQPGDAAAIGQIIQEEWSIGVDIIVQAPSTVSPTVPTSTAETTTSTIETTTSTTEATEEMTTPPVTSEKSVHTSQTSSDAFETTSDEAITTPTVLPSSLPSNQTKASSTTLTTVPSTCWPTIPPPSGWHITMMVLQTLLLVVTSCILLTICYVSRNRGKVAPLPDTPFNNPQQSIQA